MTLVEVILGILLGGLFHRTIELTAQVALIQADLKIIRRDISLILEPGRPALDDDGMTLDR
ncbi:MAG: hypothetical protein HC925_09760 [Coleofasciculaceae cyanobacterium SM2_3_26]|nr:hypothetical protein [Coleofasciculaceae cyanobacterium SM2_3_26]